MKEQLRNLHEKIGTHNPPGESAQKALHKSLCIGAPASGPWHQRLSAHMAVIDGLQPQARDRSDRQSASQRPSAPVSRLASAP